MCINGKINRRALPGVGTQTIAAKVTAPNGTIATLDPRFLCGLAGASTTSATLGLDPSKAHQVVVASIDSFGNVTATAPVTSAAGPATSGSDMGGADAGGSTSPTKSHGCSIGGAATSSPWALAFVMLALGALVARPRRRRQ
jgi:MYXO-CTERM domain-containing protein